jgi:hypothetical protein
MCVSKKYIYKLALWITCFGVLWAGFFISACNSQQSQLVKKKSHSLKFWEIASEVNAFEKPQIGESDADGSYGLSAGVVKIIRHNGLYTVKVCFAGPDTIQHWLPAKAYVDAGEGLLYDFEDIVSIECEIEDLGNIQIGYNCYLLQMPEDKIGNHKNYQIVITEIGGEKGWIPETEQVNRILDAENTGIRMECRYWDWGGGCIIVDKPGVLSLSEAHQIAYETAWMRMYTGPWIFTVKE